MNTACEIAKYSESISGPYRGFYLASYAVRIEEGYIGFAKICLGHPGDVWECDPMSKGASPPARNPPAAVAAAEKLALATIDGLVVGSGAATR